MAGLDPPSRRIRQPVMAHPEVVRAAGQVGRDPFSACSALVPVAECSLSMITMDPCHQGLGRFAPVAGEGKRVERLVIGFDVESLPR
jgi:hypothetical protein